MRESMKIINGINDIELIIWIIQYSILWLTTDLIYRVCTV
jgi:hypothetical protein